MNVPEPEHEDSDTALSMYLLNIFYHNQKSVLASNVELPAFGRLRQEHCHEFEDS